MHGHGPSNLNFGLFVSSFDVCRASQPFPSINYDHDEHKFGVLYYTMTEVHLKPLFQKEDSTFQSLDFTFCRSQAISEFENFLLSWHNNHQQRRPQAFSLLRGESPGDDVDGTKQVMICH